jgi:Putative addiction module component
VTDLEGGGPVPYPAGMAARLNELAAQAMNLPAEARVRLADLLVESLDGEDLDRVGRLWIAEAKRRRDEVRAKEVKPISGTAALRRVRDAVRR